MKGDATEWLKSGEYLPEWLRDFHDQKDFFKALDEVADRSREGGNRYIDGIGFAAAQVFTVDIFLWMAARHGYTLQRSRKRVEFNDLDAFVGDAKRRRNGAYREMWASRLPAESGLSDLAAKPTTAALATDKPSLINSLPIEGE